MTLLINNEDVRQVLTMEKTMAALDEAYADYAIGEAVCRPRIDIRIPTKDPSRFYQFGTMEGGSTRGYFGIRMKSDVIWYDEYGGTRTQEKYCVQPGLFCGLVWLFSIDNGEPQWPHAVPAARSIGAPQFEQFTMWTFRRSSSTCAGDSGRMKSFSRRKLKKEIRRP